MNSFIPFSCSECGSEVRLARGAGRTYEYVRGYNVPIPDEFDIPTCCKCGDTYIVPEIEDSFNDAMNKAFLPMQGAHYRELVQILIERHGVTQRDIGRVCAITPSYLSHLMAGTRQASTTLTRLLEAFVADGREFQRHLANKPWTRTLESVPLYPVKNHGRGSDSWGTVLQAKWSEAKNDTDRPASPGSKRGFAENVA